MPASNCTNVPYTSIGEPAGAGKQTSAGAFAENNVRTTRGGCWPNRAEDLQIGSPSVAAEARLIYTPTVSSVNAFACSTHPSFAFSTTIASVSVSAVPFVC